MLMCLMYAVYLVTSPNGAPEPQETLQLLEQYDSDAARCDDIACIDDELDGLDGKILMLLGQRAAVIRHRMHLAHVAQDKRRTLAKPQQAAARLVWLRQRAREVSVPEALADPVMRALVKASDAYEGRPKS